MNAFLEPLSNTIVVNKLDIIFGTSLGLFKYCDKNDKNHDNISSISLNIVAKMIKIKILFPVTSLGPLASAFARALAS